MIKKIKNEDYKLVDKINNIDYSHLTDLELLACSEKLKKYAGSEESTESLFIEAYALACESSKRNLSITPFDVQLLGALFLGRNVVIQMETGEGKTLCAVFAAYADALLGRHVHVLTFNDYLAKRDANWMRPVYESLGISVSYITSDMEFTERKKAYNCDVTYVTAKEAGFDYLRDCLAYDEEEMVHHGFDSVIIDEADSILIDEAGVPLVIAGEKNENENETVSFSNFVKGLNAETDYQIDDYGRNVFFSDEGVNRIEDYFQISNLYDDSNFELLTNLNCALHGEALLTRDINYIVKDGRVQLIDENTGRIALNRHWPDGLQEAVEAKEGLVQNDKGMILGNITILNFLKLYHKKSGMTGTAVTSHEEFSEMYDLDVVRIPPNKKSIRMDYEDQVYRSVREKNKAILREIKVIHETERPILIGTCSIEESEHISNALRLEGIECTVLNAKNDEFEAELIATAGVRNAITVSTNMAGRGVDIKLGGGENGEADIINKLGGLCVIVTSKNESARVDQQLRGRAGRQGDAGSSKCFVSIEDDLMVRFGMTESLSSSSMKLKTDHTGRIMNKNISVHITYIQKVIEGQNHEIRITLNKYAYMLEQQREIHQELRTQILLGNFADIIEGNQFLAKQILLYELDNCWVDFLEYVNYIREGIHLVSLGREDPLYHYHLQIIEAFKDMKSEFSKSVARELLILGEKGKAYVPKRVADVTSPTATWTYIISDNEFLNRIRKGKFNKNQSHFVTMKGVIMWPQYLFEYFKAKKYFLQK